MKDKQTQHDSDDWKGFRDDAREFRQNKAEEQRAVIETWCGVNEVYFTAIADHHFRLMQDTFTLDIYPQQNKYHNVTKNKRGRYSDITTFLNQQFNTKNGSN